MTDQPTLKEIAARNEARSPNNAEPGSTVADIDALLDVVRQKDEALEKIAEGRGRFRVDQLEFASNVIEEAKETARAALALTRDEKG